jgi:hypothetical protein
MVEITLVTGLIMIASVFGIIWGVLLICGYKMMGTVFAGLTLSFWRPAGFLFQHRFWEVFEPIFRQGVIQ